jgi:hypothetical protein
MKAISRRGLTEWVRHDPDDPDAKHRRGAPASLHPGGATGWHEDGETHRPDGPAHLMPDGHQQWFLHDRHHRPDGPARIAPDGNVAWIENGRNHRLLGPARSGPGVREWWVGGHIHRAAKGGKISWHFGDGGSAAGAVGRGGQAFRAFLAVAESLRDGDPPAEVDPDDLPRDVARSADVEIMASLAPGGVLVAQVGAPMLADAFLARRCLGAEFRAARALVIVADRPLAIWADLEGEWP